MLSTKLNKWDFNPISSSLYRTHTRCFTTFRCAPHWLWTSPDKMDTKN